MQDERGADQAALGQGRVAMDSNSDRTRRRASDKTDSSDSSSAGACHHTHLQLWDADSRLLFTVSYFRPVQVMAEHEALKRQLKDVQEHRVTDIKEAEERVDRRVREAVREAEERADRRVREAEERRVSDLKDVKRRVQEAEERRVSDLERSERLLNAILGSLIFDISCRCS
jgi:hypothetical protein